MIKRTVEISQQAVHLAVKNGQLLLLPRGGETPLASIPCEDLGVLLVDQCGTTYTHQALLALLEHDAAVVLCGHNHLPAGLLLPMAEHSQVVWRLQDQLAAPKPLRKQLWRQLVQAKIRAQAGNLPDGTDARSGLLAFARQVRSGDPANVEARAAKLYWANWLADEPFHRDPDGTGLNSFLNYGYAVVRAGVARAIVSAGLLPTVGIHHCSRSNAFCLADDLVEPLRPLVDACVRGLRNEGASELNPEAKRGLLTVLTAEVRCGDQAGPLMVALHRMVASLVRCFEGSAKRLEIPVACVSASEGDTHVAPSDSDLDGDVP
ncbi:MAG TPA: type II CRISPR-associated endonuclease Cas1 [Phycisphaerae bacterium]|nr:type II CRISPR-associated endonuclease Cas1 [Phycisphaerae bacterium]HNU44302.1 type II CRISPR-associated endonuclease Cas1 [Phycisphaerae bacterium]